MGLHPVPHLNRGRGKGEPPSRWSPPCSLSLSSYLCAAPTPYPPTPPSQPCAPLRLPRLPIQSVFCNPPSLPPSPLRPSLSSMSIPSVGCYFTSVKSDALLVHGPNRRNSWSFRAESMTKDDRVCRRQLFLPPALPADEPLTPPAALRIPANRFRASPRQSPFAARCVRGLPIASCRLDDALTTTQGP